MSAVIKASCLENKNNGGYPKGGAMSNVSFQPVFLDVASAINGAVGDVKS